MADIKLDANVFGQAGLNATEQIAQQKNKDPGGLSLNRLADVGALTGKTTMSTELAVRGVEKALASPTLRPIMNSYGVGTFHEDVASLPQTQDEMSAYFDTKGVAPEDRASISSRAVSKDHLEFLVSNYLDQKESQARLADQGTLGTVGSITGSFFDPVTTVATLGSGSAVKGLVSMGTKLARGEQAAAALTKGLPGYGIGTTGAFAGGYATGIAEQEAQGHEVNLQEATRTAITFAALHSAFEAGGLAFRKIKEKKNAEASVLAAEDAGVPVNRDQTDEIIHGEINPVSDPKNYTKQGELFGEAPMLSKQDLADKEVQASGQLFGSTVDKPMEPTTYKVKGENGLVAVQPKADNGLDTAIYNYDRASKEGKAFYAKTIQEYIPGATESDIAKLSKDLHAKAKEAAMKGEQIDITGSYKEIVKPVYKTGPVVEPKPAEAPVAKPAETVAPKQQDMFSPAPTPMSNEELAVRQSQSSGKLFPDNKQIKPEEPKAFTHKEDNKVDLKVQPKSDNGVSTAIYNFDSSKGPKRETYLQVIKGFIPDVTEAEIKALSKDLKDRALQAALKGEQLDISKSYGELVKTKYKEPTAKPVETPAVQPTQDPALPMPTVQGEMFDAGPTITKEQLSQRASEFQGKLLSDENIDVNSIQVKVGNSTKRVSVSMSSGIDVAFYKLSNATGTMKEFYIKTLKELYPGSSEKFLLQQAEDLKAMARAKAEEAAKRGEKNVVLEDLHKNIEVKPVYKEAKAQELEQDVTVPKEIDNEFVDHLKQPKVKPDPEVTYDPKKPRLFQGKAESAKEVKTPAEAVGVRNERYKSKIPPSKLHSVRWPNTDSGKNVTLRFESHIDRDLFLLSFETKPKDAQKRINKILKVMPKGSTTQDVLDLAESFRTNDLRRYVNEFPKRTNLDVPNTYGKEDLINPKANLVLKVAAGTVGVVGVGAATAQEANANPLAGGAAVAGEALLSGTLGVAGLLVAKKGDLNVARQALAKLRIPLRGNKVIEVPMGSEFAGIPANSVSDTAVFLGDSLLTSVASKKGRALVKNGADVIKHTELEANMNAFKDARTTGLQGWAKEKNIATTGIDFRTGVIDQFERDFYRHKENPALRESPALRKAADELYALEQKVYRQAQETLEAAKASGVVFDKTSQLQKIIDSFTPKADYVRLVHNFEAIRTMAVKDKEQFTEMITQSYMKATGAEYGVARAKASVFGNLLLRLESDVSIIRLARLDVTSATEELVRRGWVKGDTAQDVISMLATLHPEKNPSITQQRFSLDRNYEHSYKDANGVTQVMKVKDMYTQDLGITFADWADQIHGTTALVKASMKQGYDLSSQANLEALLEKAWSEGATKKEIDTLRAAWLYVKGDAGHTDMFGETTKFWSTVRTATSIMLGKWFPAVVMPEGVANLFGAQFARAHRKAMPGFSDAIKLLTGRQVDDPFSRALQAAVGVGNEGIGSVARYNMEHGIVDKANQHIRIGAAKVFLGNFTTGLNNLFKTMNARAVAQFAYDISTGVVKVSDDYIAKHLHPLGIDKAMLNELSVLFAKHAEVDSRGIINRMNFEAIHAENPYLAAQFESAMRKHAYTQAAEPASVGAKSPLLTSDINKTVGMFLQPVLISVNRTRRDLHNFSPDIAGRWAASFMAAGLAYTGRTYAQYGNDEKKLNEMLTVSEVAKAAFRNSAFSGLLPLFTDIGLTVTGFDPMFSNSANRGFGAITPPPFGLTGQLMGAAKTGAKLVTGQDVTKNDVKSALGMIQFGQWWTQPAVNAISEAFPDKLPKKAKTPKPTEADRIF